MSCCLQAAHDIGLPEPGSHVAAAPSEHEVAVGDAAGMVLLFDVRKPDEPTSCTTRKTESSVSCIQCTTQSETATYTAHRSRCSGGTGLNPSVGGSEVPSCMPLGS
jgi:hypothetical protein